MNLFATCCVRIVAAVLVSICAWGTSSAQETRTDELFNRALALSADIKHGSSLYRAHCADCHGADATGDARSATPTLAGQKITYLIKQLADEAEGYRELPDMHRLLAGMGIARPQVLRDIASYLASLPPVGDPQHGDGKNIELGKRTYEYVCMQCHGEHGQGDRDGSVPAVRGQHYSYLLLQARQLASGHRLAVDMGVIALLDGMSIDQITAVADYMSRLTGRGDEAGSEPAPGIDKEYTSMQTSRIGYEDFPIRIGRQRPDTSQAVINGSVDHLEAP